MKVFFMGTAPFAVASLKTLVDEGFHVAAVITQPDRPRGRGHQVQISAVKAAALELDLTVWQPEKIGDLGELEKISALGCDAGVVVAYGQILSAAVLGAPRLGCFNLHASLLPRWRGAAPVHWAVAKGDVQTGVCVQKMAVKLDAGDVLLSSAIDIGFDDTATLLEKLAPLGAALLVEAMRGVQAGTLTAGVQDESKVVYAPLLKKEDGLADFKQSASQLVRRCQAFSGQPGFRTRLMPQGLELKLFDLCLASGQGTPGTVIGREQGDWIVACGEGAVKVGRIQPAGKKAMRPVEFENGHALTLDAFLG